MEPSGDNERKRKVVELFGDITDIELEDRDNLDMFCKWTAGVCRVQAIPLVCETVRYT
jgi:hypothetical protein